LILRLFIRIDSLFIWTRNNHERGGQTLRWIFPKRERAVQAHAFLRIYWVRRATLDFWLKTIKSQSYRWPPKKLTERDRTTGIWPWHQWLIPKMFYIPNYHLAEGQAKGLVPALFQFSRATNIGYLYHFAKSFLDW
jgi:hypothetical protein